MRLLILALLVAPFVQEEEENKNDAEKLFDKMVETVTKAKTLHLKAVAEFTEEERKSKVDLDLFLKEGNKMYQETTMTSDRNPKERKSTFVSNGSKAIARSGDRGGPPQPTPKNLTRAYLAAFAKGGVWVMVTGVTRDRLNGVEKIELVEATDFKLGEKEKIAGRDAQIIEFESKILGAKEKLHVKLWIDAKTHLPMKRTLTGINKSKEKVTIEETYEILEVDKEIADDKFKIGEKKKDDDK